MPERHLTRCRLALQHLAVHALNGLPAGWAALGGSGGDVGQEEGDDGTTSFHGKWGRGAEPGMNEGLSTGKVEEQQLRTGEIGRGDEAAELNGVEAEREVGNV
jgi:hypothetical protein